jgi:regulator of protease activity HflC (stomatin/prohibitin superfamily)
MHPSLSIYQTFISGGKETHQFQAEDNQAIRADQIHQYLITDPQLMLQDT